MYDLIIVGTGPAGLTAAIYAARYKMNFLAVGRVLGGTTSEASVVENYPGFKSISGIDLTNKIKEQVEFLGGKIIQDDIKNIQKKNSHFEIFNNNEVYKSKTLILAFGTETKKLNIPGEVEFMGKGVSYCATCDGAFFKGKNVVVIGGSDAAATAALLLADLAKGVYIIYRRDKLRAEPIWVEKIKKTKNIKIIYNTNIIEIKGKATVRKVILDNPYQNQKELEIDGVFIEIGETPVTSIIKNLKIKTDKLGYIITDQSQKTNLSGVYAAGDITTSSNNLKQIITACSEGAIAVNSVYNYLKTLK
ncbi:MAG: thioredoxin-disulfide reductase [Candidatus Aenigmarchaeota archaeon]|nr:thioredoxin-disulfide reductase [Candidatus Aenigmarchaeota archaeon]